MILHCTQKLAAKLPSSLLTPGSSSEQALEDSALASWHAHVLTLDRRQCVLFCHDATRFVLFLPGMRASQFADLGRWHRSLLLATLAAQGLDTVRLARVELVLGGLSVDRYTDRSVLGSLRVAAEDLKYGLLTRTANVMELDPITSSRLLNERPVTIYGTVLWPEQAMRQTVEQL